MAKLTKGTRVWFIDPADESLVRITKITAFNPGSSPGDNIEVTDLEETEARRYEKGLATPGQATGTIMANPAEASHVRLHALATGADTNIMKFAIGWSDGTADPTVDSAGNFNFPTTRTFYTFEGHVTDFPLDFQLNATVQTALAIQRSGKGTLVPKAA